jgi:hypothetical protein
MGRTMLYELQAPKDLRIIVHPDTIHPSTIHFCIKIKHHSTNNLEHALIFLKHMVNEQVYMSLVLLGKLSLILRLGKVVHVLGN